MREVFEVNARELGGEETLRQVREIMEAWAAEDAASAEFDAKATLPVTVTLTVGQWLIIMAMIGAVDGVQYGLGAGGEDLYNDAAEAITVGVELAWPGAFDAV